MTSIRELLEGKIDFHGQKKADNIARIALVLTTIFSFIVGFALQSLWATMGTFAACTVLVGLAVVPPWEIYNRHPVKWAPAQPAKESKSK